jgi:GTPase Era involved in 16S rRNA processing
MNTQAADAWLILNDADAVETKMLATMNRVLRDRSNQEMFMNQLANTSAFHNAVMNMSMQGSMTDSINRAIRQTLESAEVMIQDDYMTRTPRIAVRFQAPGGQTFVIQPRVSRS